ncbi:hypothetical protein LR48_Vigan03g059300 [Vigna angularis]|uniref:Transmembrane protein n=1 Tax=Phaseolus angularis TaxID=3914 RepID=A0A0L9U3G3_PHAAN|nr:hypothetical protein LR48_Vigan03g059300 [Vigna angularis]
MLPIDSPDLLLSVLTLHSCHCYHLCCFTESSFLATHFWDGLMRIHLIREEERVSPRVSTSKLLPFVVLSNVVVAVVAIVAAVTNFLPDVLGQRATANSIIDVVVTNSIVEADIFSVGEGNGIVVNADEDAVGLGKRWVRGVASDELGSGRVLLVNELLLLPSHFAFQLFDERKDSNNYKGSLPSRAFCHHQWISSSSFLCGTDWCFLPTSPLFVSPNALTPVAKPVSTIWVSDLSSSTNRFSPVLPPSRSVIDVHMSFSREGKKSFSRRRIVSP